MDKRLLKAREEHNGKKFKNRNGDEATVIHYNGKYDVRIRFTESGSERIVGSTHLRSGAFTDYARLLGKEFTNAKGHTFTVIKTDGKYSTVEFNETGFVTTETNSNVQKGVVKDRYAKDTCGIGFYGNPDISTEFYVKGRNLWNGMLRRCYSEKFRPNSKIVKPEVCNRWHSLENFLVDLPKIKNFDKWLVEPMHLDKDLIGNSKLYSLETTVFLTPKENRDEQTTRYRTLI